MHLRGRGCPVSAGPPRHLPHPPLPLHPPTSSSSMGSHLHRPPQTHTAPHNPHPLYTTTPSPPTPSPTLHHNHTPAPTGSTPTPFIPSYDLVQMPPVGHAQPPRVSLYTLIPSEARVSHRVPRGCREEGRQGAPNRGGAGEWCRGPTVPCLCPLSLI